MRSLILWLLAFGLVSSTYGATKSCAGFVNSEVLVDLSRIQVKLLTERGNLKYETECNPTDGFYTLPVYTPGRYRIEIVAPEGWKFEKNVRTIEIADDDSGAIAGGDCQSDINFTLCGFTISGVVRSSGAAGPSGFSLALYESTGGKLVASTTTRKGGVYEFIAKPGSYLISTDNRNAQCIDRGKVSIRVVNGPIRVHTDIQIAGYNLKVVVRDESGAALAGAEVTLTASAKLQLDSIPVNAQQPQIERRDSVKWDHVLRSDSSGVVHFYCLPPGAYTIDAAWQTTDVRLNFGESAPLTIDTEAAELTLKAVSFDITGALAGESIAGVAISLNGAAQPAASTDASGRYTLRALTVGNYRLTALKEHYEFAPVDVRLSGTAGVTLPPLTIQRLAVCGIVDSDGSKSSAVRLSVRKADGGSAEHVVIDRKTGRFCTLLTPGSYVLEPSKSTDYSFSPASVPLTIKNTPVLNLRFTQFKAVVTGEVKCFEACKNVIIQLWQNNELVSEQTSTGAFKFDDVVPASYKVKVLDDYNFWWEKSSHAFVVTDADVSDLVFRQTGYKAVIHASHPCHLKYAPLSAPNSELTARLQEGDTAIFIPHSGKYSYAVSDSCYQFTMTADRSGGVPTTHIVVPNAERWLLSATKTRVSASVRVSGQPIKGASIHLILKTQDGNEFTVDESIVIDSKTHQFTFYIDQASAGQTFSVTPRSNKYVFRPNAATFSFLGECLKDVATFHAEVGKVISGQIMPVVEGVQMTLTNRKDPANILRVQSDASGKYSVGGIWNVGEWTVGAAKPGYEFKPVDQRPFDFRSVKLSYLRIDFVDLDTTKLLAEVMVSISGPNNYRSSHVVDNSGSLEIIGLAFGEYFVRPMLQEYKFNATSISFTIREGETEKLNLYAKKFAYSAFGKITTISKQPIAGVVRIEAVSEQCNNHQEEFTTSPHRSEFRIRGLRPECVYRLTLKNESGQRISSFPPFVDVMTGTTDRHGVDLIVTTAESQLTVFGRVDWPEAKTVAAQPPTSSYRIELRKGGALVREIIVKHPSSVFFIPSIDISDATYSLAIDKSEAKKLGVQPIVIDFVADSAFKYVKLPIQKERRVGEVEVSRTNFLGLLLIILIALWFLNQSTAKVITEKLADYTRVIVNNAQIGESSGDEKKRKAKK